MDTSQLTSVVGLLVALSVASERLVEIIKGGVPPLTGKGTVLWKENVRRSANQALAVGAGILTAYLARPAIPAGVLQLTDDAGAIQPGVLHRGPAIR